MAFREQDFCPPCTDCSRASSDACQRCGRPLCDEHRPPPDRRCRVCEEDFEVEMAWSGPGPEALAHRRHLEARGNARRGLRLWAAGALVATAASVLTIFYAGLSTLTIATVLATVMTYLGTVLAAGERLAVGLEPAAERRRLRRARRRFLRERAPTARLPSTETTAERIDSDDD